MFWFKLVYLTIQPISSNRRNRTTDHAHNRTHHPLILHTRAILSLFTLVSQHTLVGTSGPFCPPDHHMDVRPSHRRKITYPSGVSRAATENRAGTAPHLARRVFIARPPLAREQAQRKPLRRYTQQICVRAHKSHAAVHSIWR